VLLGDLGVAAEHRAAEPALRLEAPAGARDDPESRSRTWVRVWLARRGAAPYREAQVRTGAVLSILLVSAAARADRIVGFRVRGDSKVTERTMERLSHVATGDEVGPGDLPQIRAALLSSELFTAVDVALEPAAGGVVVIATVDDKHSWVAAPTLFVLPGSFAVGAGFAENDFRGEDEKILLYGQLGTRETFFYGTFLVPQLGDTHLFARVDVLPSYRVSDEYDNTDARSPVIVRTSTETYLDAGLLGGYRFAWWLASDVRLRGAWLHYADAHAPDGGALPPPEVGGWDISLETHTLFDARAHRFGVTSGPFVLLYSNVTVPLVSTYTYALGSLHGGYAWRLFGEHELEVRAAGDLGWHMPFRQEVTLGGASDMRGYAFHQLRGDTLAGGRAEYSVPLFRYRPLAFRALTFFDTGYLALRHGGGNTQRDYLPVQHGAWFRNAVGAGLRVYVKSVVLPLLGFDVGYGLESRSPEIYFELGLTDF
jgi:outer membrane protein insertion porin family